LKKARLDGKTRQQNVFDFLQRVPSLGKFDLIFADPPYEQMSSGEKFTDQLLANNSLPTLLDDGGIFVLEKKPEEALPEIPLWTLVRQKTYGATEVLFLATDRRSEMPGAQSPP